MIYNDNSCAYQIRSIFFYTLSLFDFNNIGSVFEKITMEKIDLL
jgi:hypothetical protein